MLNGHEWVDRQAHAHAIAVEKEGTCFVGGSFQALDQLAETLREPHAIGRLTEVCDRWIYSSCLCFALDLEAQARSRFRYRYSCYQLEYSRNLVFRRGTTLDQVYQGLIDRTRALLDVPTLKTVFGWKQRPHKHRRDGARLERVLDASAYDLTVFTVHVGPLTLKLYDKGARVRRVEAIAHNVRALRCGRSVEKLSIMLAKLQRMAIDFLNVVHAAHSSFFDDGALDTLSDPTHRGTRRLAGVDLQKPRIRSVSAAVVALAAQPGGFTTEELAAKTRALWADRPGPLHGAPRRVRSGQAAGQSPRRARCTDPSLPCPPRGHSHARWLADPAREGHQARPCPRPWIPSRKLAQDHPSPRPALPHPKARAAPYVPNPRLSRMIGTALPFTTCWYSHFPKRLSTQHGGNISRTARSLGLSRGVLRAKLQRYGLR